MTPTAMYEWTCPQCGHVHEAAFIRPGAVAVCAGCHRPVQLEEPLVRRLAATNTPADGPLVIETDAGEPHSRPLVTDVEAGGDDESVAPLSPLYRSPTAAAAAALVDMDPAHPRGTGLDRARRLSRRRRLVTTAWLGAAVAASAALGMIVVWVVAPHLNNAAAPAVASADHSLAAATNPPRTPAAGHAAPTTASPNAPPSAASHNPLAALDASVPIKSARWSGPSPWTPLHDQIPPPPPAAGLTLKLPTLVVVDRHQLAYAVQVCGPSDQQDWAATLQVTVLDDQGRAFARCTVPVASVHAAARVWVRTQPLSADLALRVRDVRCVAEAVAAEPVLAGTMTIVPLGNPNVQAVKVTAALDAAAARPAFDIIALDAGGRRIGQWRVDWGRPTAAHALLRFAARTPVHADWQVADWLVQPVEQAQDSSHKPEE